MCMKSFSKSLAICSCATFEPQGSLKHIQVAILNPPHPYLRNTTLLLDIYAWCANTHTHIHTHLPRGYKEAQSQVFVSACFQIRLDEWDGEGFPEATDLDENVVEWGVAVVNRLLYPTRKLRWLWITGKFVSWQVQSLQVRVLGK